MMHKKIARAWKLDTAKIYDNFWSFDKRNHKLNQNYFISLPYGGELSLGTKVSTIIKS